MNKMEHITVMYFSPVGGAKKACLDLAMEMGERVKDADFCSPEGEYSPESEDTVIVGVPVPGGRVPEYTMERLTYLKGDGAAALIAAVYGDRAPEDVFLGLDGCLKTQGLRIGARTALLAGHSTVRDAAVGRPGNQDRKEMADLGVRIFEKLEEGGWQGPQMPGNRPYCDWKQTPVVPLTNASCILRGLCAVRCPVQVIPVSNSSLMDQTRCILCIRRVPVYPMEARSLPEQACAVLEQKLSSIRDIRRENELFL